METDHKLILRWETEERTYRLEIENNSPLGETYEAIMGFRNHIVQLINEHGKNLLQQTEKETPS